MSEKQEKPKSSIPVELIRRLLVFPFKEDAKSVHLYSANELSTAQKKELEFISDKHVVFEPKSKAEVTHLIEENYRLDGSIGEITGKSAKNGTEAVVSRHEDEAGRNETQSISSTQVQILDFILRDAIKKRSTDIHIEKAESEVKVRFRIDGILIPQEVFDVHFYDSIVSRIKIVANLDIGERRLPQDGKFKFDQFDIRVSILPGYSGECVVLRILSGEVKNHSLLHLGFYPEHVELIKAAISKSNGLILVAGPTGSGKNTTLYAILQMLDFVGKKIITIEDPVEYVSRNFLQIQVKPEIGLDFARGLRSVLRSDPDVLLIGEIRDKETGEIAVEFSNTGHLVFSTVHANDNASAIRRLISDMGVSPHAVAESLRLVISQRLVRKVCKSCGETKSGETIGTGCRECHGTGYLGREAIYEIVPIDEGLRNQISEGTLTQKQIDESIKKSGIGSVVEISNRKIKDGITNKVEVSRVI